MIIKDGYNNAETEIKVGEDERSADWSIPQKNTTRLWIRESGKDDRESLSYLTPNELLELFNEIKKAGHNLFT